MAAKHKYTVEFNGQTFTRRTARTYTHVILARTGEAEWLAASLAQVTQASKYHAFYGKTREAYLEELIADAHRQCAAVKESGGFVGYVALTWCGRPDLAQKAASKAQSTGWYSEVLIVPVPPIG